MVYENECKTCDERYTRHPIRNILGSFLIPKPDIETVLQSCGALGLFTFIRPTLGQISNNRHPVDV